MLKVGIDASEADAALGFISGMVSTIKTDRYINSVTKYAHATMARAFDNTADIVAQGNRDGFSHVYEARLLGMPNGRLWRHRLHGGGRYKEIASFQFMPSSQPILTPSERQDNSSDPISRVSPDVLSKLSDRRYTFVHKATIMEYGLSATVRPRSGKMLFVPTMRNRGYFKFSKSTNQNWYRSNPQDASGGVGAQGRFTTFWTDWWNTEAPMLWDTRIKMTIENDLGKCQREIQKVTRGRRTRKTFQMSAFDAKADYDAGGSMAKAYMGKQIMSYAQASKYIDRAWMK